MRAPRSHIRIASLVLVVGATMLGLGSAPRAQVPARATLNAKQRLLAGEPLPVNTAERVKLLRELQQASPRPVYAPGRVIVKLADGGTEQSLRALSVRANGRSVTRPAYGDFVVLHLDPAADVVKAAAELALTPGVVYAEPDPILYPTYVPNDPLYSYQWNLQKIGMERTWDINQGADSSVVVAVIDGGVAYLDKGVFRQAPDLAGTSFVAPHDFIWDDNEPTDLDGHGTHVTGTIAQRTGNALGVAGVAFNVSIMPVKVVSGVWDVVLGAPNQGTDALLAEAIRYAADNGAQVINMSLGAEGESTPIHDAIEYALSKGVFMAAAAGNSGDEGNTPIYPAAYALEFDGLVAVAALDYNLARSFYSNSNPYVEIAAPGGDTRVDLNNDSFADGILQQTINQDLAEIGVFNEFRYEFFQGTSMASPHVAGLAALLVKQGVKDPRGIEKIIEHFATDIGPAGRDNDTGFGVINPSAAIYGIGLAK